MEKTDHAPRRAPYRLRGNRAWALIRARYLAGEGAPRLAEVFDVTEYAIRQRITREGWSKRSLAEAEEAGMSDPEAPPMAFRAAGGGADDGDLDPRAAARRALDEAVRLMRAGKMSGAAEAARVADVLARAAARLDGDRPAEPGEPDEAAFEAVRRKVLGTADEAPSPSTASRSPSPLLRNGEETD